MGVPHYLPCSTCPALVTALLLQRFLIMISFPGSMAELRTCDSCVGDDITLQWQVPSASLYSTGPSLYEEGLETCSRQPSA